MLTLIYLLVSPFPRGHQLFKGLCLPSVALTPTYLVPGRAHSRCLFKEASCAPVTPLLGRVQGLF